MMSIAKAKFKVFFMFFYKPFLLVLGQVLEGGAMLGLQEIGMFHTRVFYLLAGRLERPLRTKRCLS